MNRQPIVAGQFYPGSADELAAAVKSLTPESKKSDTPALLSMVPHAGYVFSGAVCGKTLAKTGLNETILLLGPNHTGVGRPMAVWPEGIWAIPGGGLFVNTDLAETLIQKVPAFEGDFTAHVGEHSLEVIVPFLAHLNPEASIVPVCISEARPDVLVQTGEELAEILKEWPTPVSIVVSSDMSHYISHDEAAERDAFALGKIKETDPEGLYATVREKGISMCGVLPMTIGLAAARALGAKQTELVEYITSGEVSGDFERVVGYAGCITR